MIEYDTGVPGSGKSYKGIYSLYANFGLDDKFRDKRFKFDDVDFAYTNINEIDVNAFKKNTVLKLDFDKFYDDLTILHSMYKDKVSDTELIVKAKEFNIFRCIIILDECQNYLDKNDVVLIWWLSYHRHLHHQIYLITQNLSIIYTKYKNFAEFFLKARPSSLKLFKSKMIYDQYINSRMSKNSKSGVIKIPFQNKIFKTYKSGANQQSENPLKKFLFLAIFLFFLLFFVFQVFKYKVSSSTTEDNKIVVIEDIKKNNIVTNNENYNYKVENYDNFQIYKFICFNNKLCTCDGFSGVEIPFIFLKMITKDVKKEYRHTKLQGNRLIIYIFEDENKMNFLNNNLQRGKNEKDFSDSVNIFK